MRPRILFALAILILCFSIITRAKDKTVLVTCGSVIKLQHDKTRHLLHSQEVSYGGGRGSGQQSVTGFPEADSFSSMWIIRGAEEYCEQGTPIPNTAHIKLQHATTRKWLHSHQFYSPLTNNQEVSCFGGDDSSDTGDYWIVEWDDKKREHWQQDTQVRLRHMDTGAYLANHDVKYQRPIPGHSEVHALKSKNAATVWWATEGVFFPDRNAADE